MGSISDDNIKRSQAQHELCKEAFGGSLTLNTINLNQPGLKILDVGTGDGYWLHDLRSQLSSPETADLVGSDTNILPAEQRVFEIPHNMRFLYQHPFEDWPRDLHGYFDLIHVQATLSDSFDSAVDAVARLLLLVKPGGTILLIDRCFEPGTTDSPHHRLFRNMDIDGTLGRELAVILDCASGKAGIPISDVGNRKRPSRIGQGAKEGMEEVGYVWLDHLLSSVSRAGKQVEDPKGISGDINEMFAQTLLEAKSEGFDVDWYAAWGRRRDNSDASTSFIAELPA